MRLWQVANFDTGLSVRLRTQHAARWSHIRMVSIPILLLGIHWRAHTWAKAYTRYKRERRTVEHGVNVVDNFYL